MTRGKLIATITISFISGMFMMWTGVWVAYTTGVTIRNADTAMFVLALKERIPQDWNGLRFIPNTHTNEVLVQKRAKKVRRPVEVVQQAEVEEK